MTASRPGRLSPPARSVGLLDRPRLFDRLDSRPVVVLAGMAGFGKSMLLSSWLAERSQPGAVAWLSLDDGDRDAQRLLSDILAALRASAEESLVAAVQQLQAPPASTDPLPWMDTLIEALYGVGVPLTLVLDDVQHLAGAPSALSQLDHLLRWAPSGTRFSLSSRVMPQLRLQRLRLDGRLEFVTHADLAFTEAETEAVVAAAGLVLSPAAVSALHRTTSGWPAGVQMALLAQRARGDGHVSGLELRRDGALADYLATEVLASLDDEVRSFVLHATVDEAVCASLVDAVRGSRDSARLLERCVDEGLFLSREERAEDSQWYRWHGLFAAHMRRHQQFETPQEARSCHLRAAKWWRPVDPATAIGHALTGQEPELAGRIFAEAWPTLVLEGRADTVLQLVEAIPESVDAAAELHLACALIYAQNGSADLARMALGRSRRAAARLPEQLRLTFQTRETVIELFLVNDRDRLDDAVAAGHLVLERIQEEVPTLDPATLALAQLCVGVGEARLEHDPAESVRLLRASAVTARAAGLHGLELTARAEACIPLIAGGDLEAIEREATAVLEAAQVRGWYQASAVAPAAGYLGWLAYWRGEQGPARTYITRALSLALPTDRGLRALGLYFRARAALLAGDVASARSDLAEARSLSGSALLPKAWGARLDGLAASIHLAAGEVHEAERLVAEAGVSTHRLVWIDRATVLLALKRPDESLANLELVPADQMYPPVATFSWAVRAKAQADLNDTDTAHRSLERALAAATPSRLLAPFLVVGPSFVPMLRDQLRRGTAYPELVAQILNRLAGDPGECVNQWGEQLTERERVVLRYLATNLTNAEIADAEFISVHTAKTHIGHIYRKLGVSNRRAAIRRAAELGLI